ncbi:hypothetical protein GCM10023200_48200 [Actinomycetospora chlora]|uniref:DUF1772 domain-containing protein n=1 Tax=Actinomycetospora chlora TaxID=663608 RepID=A0ABP9C675_9PSEU
MPTLRAVATVCAGLVAGLTLAHVLERPGASALDGATWLAVQHTFYGGFGIAGGVAEVVGLLAAGTGGVLARTRWPFVLGTVGFAGTLVAYAVGNAPVNAQVALWTLATLPPEWSVLRDRWETAHAVSAGLALVALVALSWPPPRREQP